MSNKEQMKNKNTSEKRRRKVSKRRTQKRNVMLIFAAVLVLFLVLGINGYKLHQKNEELKRQEVELQEQIDEQTARSEEIDELEDYVGTDEYVEDVAKDKLGLVNEGETILKEK